MIEVLIAFRLLNSEKSIIIALNLGDHGELKRDFKARHIQIICLRGGIGFGIFVITGEVNSGLAFRFYVVVDM